MHMCHAGPHTHVHTHTHITHTSHTHHTHTSHTRTHTHTHTHTHTSGNVAQGALEIFKLFPHEMISASDIKSVKHSSDRQQHKLIGVQCTAKDMVRALDESSFDKQVTCMMYDV